MTLSMKLGGAWKEAQSLHVKINGEWKDVATLYSKKDGAWITVYSSGALIEFLDYPYPIPVAKGWKYSTDGSTWTNVVADGEINTSGTFTGFVKANCAITLNEYYTEYIPEQIGVRIDGEALSVAREYPTSFVNNSKGYVCGGRNNSNWGLAVDVYDSSGVRSSGTDLSVARSHSTSFANGSKGYVCGGEDYSNYLSTVDVYDSSGNRTTGTSLSVGRYGSTSFANAGYGYVCGGMASGSNNKSTVDKYDSSGTRTTGTPMSVARGLMTSFVNGSKGYICGGANKNLLNVVDVYDSSGNRTTGTSLSVARNYFTSFVNGNNGYVCGGRISDGYPCDIVDVYDSSGNRTTGTSISVTRDKLTSFATDYNGYVCGGCSTYSGLEGSAVVDIYDSSGNRTTGTSLSVSKYNLTSFVNVGRGYVCGGYENTSFRSTVDVYYDIQEVLYTKLPITEGSTYTLNGKSGVADVSKVMEFDSKVSGTIKYKAGDMSPSMRITVVDESGNVVEGATVSFGDAPFTWITNTNRTWIDNTGSIYDATGDGKNIYDSSVESKIGRIEMTYVRTGKGTHTLSVTSTDGLFNGGMGGITPSLWSPAIDTSKHGSGTLTIKVYGKLGTLVQTVDFTVQMSNEPA